MYETMMEEINFGTWETCMFPFHINKTNNGVNFFGKKATGTWGSFKKNGNWESFLEVVCGFTEILQIECSQQ